MPSESEDWLKNLTLASRLRGYFDWLVGLNGTRAFSLKTNASKAVNIGRVMTPTLRFIVDRELELANFVSKPFWEVEGNFGSYKGTYFDPENDNETKFFDKAKAAQLISSLGEMGTVLSVEKKKSVKYAPMLHSLQELQNEASKIYGYSMDKTLSIAQRLYEAKILTYPRTDTGYITTAIAEELAYRFKSACLFQDLEEDAVMIMNDADRIKAMAKNKKYVNDKEVGGHFGIMPTGSTPNLATMSDEDKNIFYLVCRRLVGIFLPPMTTNNTVIITESNGHQFKTNGKVLLDIGYAKLYNQKTNDNILPDVQKGDVFSLVKAELVEKKTSPPQRYTDETLGKAMENAGKFIEDDELKDVMKKVKGLGTPATRGGIVKKLIDLKMIERKKNAYFATEYGISIVQSLGEREITKPELTALWEERLGKVEDGSYNAKQFYNEMFEYTKVLTEDIKSMSVVKTYEDSSKKGAAEVVGKCPKCGSDILSGKSGYRCSKYKDTCSVFIPVEFCKAKISKSDVKLMLDGKTTKPKKCTSAKGWTGEASFKLSAEGKLEMVFAPKNKK